MTARVEISRLAPISVGRRRSPREESTEAASRPRGRAANQRPVSLAKYFTRA
jgi:hypothetical protein